MPTIYHATSLPRRAAPPQLVFRRKKGSMRLSITLYRLLGGDAANGVAIIEHNKGYYITRADKNGHWINRGGKPKFGICSVAIYSQAMVTQLMTVLGYDPGDTVTIPVTLNPVAVDDLTLDPSLYPHPLYRLIIDQATVKTEA